MCEPWTNVCYCLHDPVPLSQPSVSQCSARSAEIGSARVKKMVARDKLLSDLKAEATAKAAAIASSPQYPQILTKLITQVR